MTLSGGGTGYTSGIGTVTMTIEDETPIVPIITVEAVLDAAEGGADGRFRFSRNGGDLSKSLTVTYTAGGTATATSDYGALSGSITFAANATTATLTVAAVDDTTVESTETVTATLATGTGYAIGVGSTDTVQIADNDGGGVISGIAWDDANANGIHGSGELGWPGLPVMLLDDAGGMVFRTVTDSAGAYEFPGLADGTYSIQFARPLTAGFTLANQGTDDTVDSDADPATGQGGTVNVIASINPVVWAGLQFIAGLTAQAQTTIVITDASSKILGANGTLKVARWEKAFKIVTYPGSVDPATEPMPILLGPDAAGLDFIDRDPDRFNVRVYDLNNWNAAVPTVDVTIETSGAGNYNDAATTLRLIRHADPGWYWSDSQILVSNKVDDEFSTGYLAADESAPLGSTILKQGIYSFPVTDRTHRIALGGTVMAKYNTGQTLLGQPIIATVSATVPVVAKVKLNSSIVGNALSGGAFQAGGYQRDITVMREIYAQAGISVEELNAVKPEPPLVNLSDGLQIRPDNATSATSLTAEEVSLLQSYRLQGVNNKYYIEVYFVNYFDQAIQGYAVTAGMVPANQSQYTPSVVLRTDHDDSTLAHEVGHILTDQGHYASVFPRELNSADRTNLMVVGKRGIVNGTIFESRRLTLSQVTRMQTFMTSLLWPV